MTEIDIGGVGLRGTIPSEIGLLKTLVKLDLEGVSEIGGLFKSSHIRGNMDICSALILCGVGIKDQSIANGISN